MSDSNQIQEYIRKRDAIKEKLDNFKFEPHMDEEFSKYVDLYNEWEELEAFIFFITSPQRKIEEFRKQLCNYADDNIVDGYMKSRGR